MLRISLVLAALALAPAASASPAADGSHALYLAQRYAHAGEVGKAVAAMRSAGKTQLSCPVVVKLKARGHVIPLCAPSAIRLPTRIAREIASLTARAVKEKPRERAALLRKAWRLNPFDSALVAPLVAALRSVGRSKEAARVQQQSLELQRGKVLIWAGVDRAMPESSGKVPLR